ncbi:MAG: nuclear transport factor 2 family protein [Candidatus Acidiferrum sp.]
MNTDDAWKLAEHWIAVWNSHDLELIMTHYDDAIELTSPVAVQLVGAGEGTVCGKENVRAYFRVGLNAYPELHFELEEVFSGVSSVVLLYRNQKGTRTAEFMELSANGKVVRVVANYQNPKH